MSFSPFDKLTLPELMFAAKQSTRCFFVYLLQGEELKKLELIFPLSFTPNCCFPAVFPSKAKNRLGGETWSDKACKAGSQARSFRSSDFLHAVPKNSSKQALTSMMSGCRVVVSGGAKGIGLAVSQALARSGARVAVLSRSEKAAIDVSAALPCIGVGQHHGKNHTTTLMAPFER
jgi:hypothetical protein